MRLQMIKSAEKFTHVTEMTRIADIGNATCVEATALMRCWTVNSDSLNLVYSINIQVRIRSRQRLVIHFGRCRLSGLTLRQSECFGFHQFSHVIRLPNRQRHNRQRRVLRPTGGEHAAIRDEQIRNIMALAETVDHAVFWLCTHTIGTQIMRGRIGRSRVCLCGTYRILQRHTLFVSVVTHRHIVGMVVSFECGYAVFKSLETPVSLQNFNGVSIRVLDEEELGQQ